MRRRFTLLLASFVFGVPIASPGAARTDVVLSYDPALDALCSALRRRPVSPVWRSELDERLPRLRETWARDGRPLLDEALVLAGRRLPGRHEVRLTLCDMPSSSLLGPVVNMRYALASFTDAPVSLSYKAATAAHELLHGMLAEVDLSRSPLLAQHANESRGVRNHLHLLALIKASLVERGREDLLAEIRRIDGALPNGDYGRAWTIIDATPQAYRAYVAEIRAAD